MNEKVLTFKPQNVVVELGGEKYSLVYDLNAFCELEKIYDSVDSILQLILGVSPVTDLDNVTYKGEVIDANDVVLANMTLPDYLASKNPVKQVKHQDTLNLLWAGTLHNHTEYDEDGEVIRYTITKQKLGSMVNFKNLREVNTKIVTAILRDLLPDGEQGKNAVAQEVQE